MQKAGSNPERAYMVASTLIIVARFSGLISPDLWSPFHHVHQSHHKTIYGPAVTSVKEFVLRTAVQVTHHALTIAAAVLLF